MAKHGNSHWARGAISSFFFTDQTSFPLCISTGLDGWAWWVNLMLVGSGHTQISVC